MAEKLCPLLKKACIEHQCHWYVHLIGSNPQSDKPIDEFGCAIGWLPILLIENAKEVRQGAAAVESFRNESVSNAEQIASGLHAVAIAAKEVKALPQ